MKPPGSPSHTPANQPHPLRRREQRAFRLGLSISIVLHLVALLLYPSLTEYLDVVSTDRLEQEMERLPDGMDVVVILAVPDLADPPVAEPPPPLDQPPDPVPEEAEPDPDPLPDAPAEPEAPAEDDEVTPETDEPGPSVAERLQPRLGDPRVWAPLDPELTDLTDHERAELMLQGMIRSWNDSVAVAAALSDRAQDWTYTDGEGRRWGLSPGRLHLGDFSIPLPFAFSPPPGQRREWNDRQWILDDLARGAVNAEIQETWAERARVIRERMEEERGGGMDGATSDGESP